MDVRSLKCVTKKAKACRTNISIHRSDNTSYFSKSEKRPTDRSTDRQIQLTHF